MTERKLVATLRVYEERGEFTVEADTELGCKSLVLAGWTTVSAPLEHVGRVIGRDWAAGKKRVRLGAEDVP